MITLIGNPGSRRVTGFAEAAARHGRRVSVVSYIDVIQSRYWEPPQGVVRIDSPGECSATARLILEAGIDPLTREGGSPVCKSAIDSLCFDRGRIIHAQQRFFGFREVLHSLETRWAGAGIRWMSTPQSIIIAFDKLACLERWAAAGLPIPHRYPRVTCYRQLRDVVRSRHARLFLKLRYGYSGMGAIALEWRDSLVRAITTVEVVTSHERPQLFVSKKPRVILRESEIEWLVDSLAEEDMLLEEWLPKARWNGRSFDLRLVTIGGRPYHAVGRANTSPFTNLNLDATRIERDELIERLGPTWATIESLGAAAAIQLPDAGMLGIDLLIQPGDKRPVLLEANAFGDYLPGLVFRGMSTWDAQLRSICAAEEAVA